jgi:protein-L-isoaspartate(D-aspartate) O-methyltransferase
VTDAFARAREQMVQEQVIARGIRDQRVIEALRKIPRHRFVEPGLARRGYDGHSLPIGQEQTISQPFVVAYMTEQLQLDRRHRVLEIGTGSGYQTALLAELAAEVCTIERHERLQSHARRVLTQLRYGNVHYHVGDGLAGWPKAIRFDRILVTAAGSEIPSRLIEQLAEGGRIIAPISGEKGQELILGVRLNGRLRRRKLLDCEFVPLVSR